MIFRLDDYSSSNHSCTLSTILNIEVFISENSGVYSKTKLWENLPKKIMYQSYKIVIEYLLATNKISLENKKVVWKSEKPNLNLNQFKSKNHSCTLSTILNILKFINENSGIYSKTKLWENLPKKIMYQSYKIVIEYLEKSNLIIIESKKVKICGGFEK